MTCINYLLWYKPCYIFFSLAQQRFIFCFYRPGIQEQHPHELLVKPSARTAVTGTRWSTCKATHMDVSCPCSLLPHGQRQQFLKSPIIHSHPATPPLSKWSEKESTERCSSVSVWTRHALTATCCGSHMSTEWESTPQRHRCQEARKDLWALWGFGADYQHAFVGTECLGIYFCQLGIEGSIWCILWRSVQNSFFPPLSGAQVEWQRHLDIRWIAFILCRLPYGYCVGLILLLKAQVSQHPRRCREQVPQGSLWSSFGFSPCHR